MAGKRDLRNVGHETHLHSIEQLERRRMLSGTAPQVVNVEVSDSGWSNEFLDYLDSEGLGTQGYSLPTGTDQLSPLPWSEIDTIRISFSEDVSVQASDLSVSGVNITAYEFSGFSYDANTYQAVWSLSTAISSDKILLDLSGDGLNPVMDWDNNILDGEWTTGSTSFPSGDGTAGGDFQFRFNLLKGDTDGNGGISVHDYAYTRILDGKTTEDEGYNPLRDINGDGVINSTDWMTIYNNMAATLPSGTPAGESNDAPTTSGIASHYPNEDVGNIVISLHDVFQDAETSDSSMTYQVMSNTNSGLFNNISINTTTGELMLSVTPDMSGQAELVVRATDAGGLHVDTSFAVDVASVNDAPVVYDFFGEGGSLNTWVFTGKVSDVDDDPTGWTVTFGGVLAGHTTTVDPDGTFTFTIQLGSGTFGDALAWTQDDDNVESNVAAWFVGVT